MGRTVKRKKKKKARSLRVGPWHATALAAALLLVVLLPLFLRGRTDSRHGAKVPKGDYIYGIDVSHHNGDGILWDSLRVMTDARRRTVHSLEKAYEIRPVSFVFIKATEGVTMRDESFRSNWKDAGKAGLRRGAYHFFLSSKDGALQAENFIKTVGEIRARDLPPVLDIESIHRGCSRELLNERALQWLRAVEKRYGRKPIVYSGASFARNYLSPAITSEYEIWIAHYGAHRPAFDGWTYWQFTDRALVRGVPRPVDLSVRKVGR